MIEKSNQVLTLSKHQNITDVGSTADFYDVLLILLILLTLLTLLTLLILLILLIVTTPSRSVIFDISSKRLLFKNISHVGSFFQSLSSW